MIILGRERRNWKGDFISIYIQGPWFKKICQRKMDIIQKLIHIHEQFITETVFKTNFRIPRPGSNSFSLNLHCFILLIDRREKEIKRENQSNRTILDWEGNNSTHKKDIHLHQNLEETFSCCLCSQLLCLSHGKSQVQQKKGSQTIIRIIWIQYKVLEESQKCCYFC